VKWRILHRLPTLCKDFLRVGYPVRSSPPSTPITLPVIQRVPSTQRAAMAEATSPGVVRR